MHAEEGVAHFAPTVAFREQIGQDVKVAGRFRHFLSFHEQVRAMQPVAHERREAAATFRLRNLCFVMREDVVAPAAMDVELIA